MLPHRHPRAETSLGPWDSRTMRIACACQPLVLIPRSSLGIEQCWCFKLIYSTQEVYLQFQVPKQWKVFNLTCRMLFWWNVLLWLQWSIHNLKNLCNILAILEVRWPHWKPSGAHHMELEEDTQNCQEKSQIQEGTAQQPLIRGRHCVVTHGNQCLHQAKRILQETIWDEVNRYIPLLSGLYQ